MAPAALRSGWVGAITQATNCLNLLDACRFDQACARRPDLLVGGATPLTVIRQLFEFSLVGYQRTGGVGGGSEYIWRYIDTTIRLDEAATNFRIHAGLMEALGLKKFRRGDAPIETAEAEA